MLYLLPNWSRMLLCGLSRRNVAAPSDGTTAEVSFSTSDTHEDLLQRCRELDSAGAAAAGGGRKRSHEEAQPAPAKRPAQ